MRCAVGEEQQAIGPAFEEVQKAVDFRSDCLLCSELGDSIELVTNDYTYRDRPDPAVFWHTLRQVPRSPKRYSPPNNLQTQSSITPFDHRAFSTTAAINFSSRPISPSLHTSKPDQWTRFSRLV